MERKVWSTEDLIETLALSRTTIDRHLRNGTLTGMKIGGSWRFTTEDLERYVGPDRVASLFAETGIAPTPAMLLSRATQGAISTEAWQAALGLVDLEASAESDDWSDTDDLSDWQIECEALLRDLKDSPDGMIVAMSKERALALWASLPAGIAERVGI